MTDIKYWVALNQVSRLGTVKFRKLEAYFGSLERAWHASASDLKFAGMDDRVLQDLEAVKVRTSPDLELERLERGGVRAVNWHDETYPSRMKEIAEGVAQGMGCSAEVDAGFGIGPVVNDANVTARARDVFSRFGDNVQVVSQPWMASEDVGLLMERNPGAYLLVGSANRARSLDYPHHHPRFDFDERVLPLGVGIMSAAIADYLVAG